MRIRTVTTRLSRANFKSHVQIASHVLHFDLRKYTGAMMAAEESPRKKRLSPAERQQTIDKLYKEGGFVIVNETLVSVHRSGPEGHGWDTVDYGIPAVIATRDKLVMCIADANTGAVVHKFKIDSSSQYTALKDHFHILRHKGCGQEDSFVYGFSFPDVVIARTLLCAISELVPSNPPSKLRKLEEVEETDFGDSVKPDVCEAGKAVKEEEKEEAIEEVDFRFFTLGRKSKNKRVLEISSPTEFRHLGHVENKMHIRRHSAREGMEVEKAETEPLTQPVEPCNLSFKPSVETPGGGETISPADQTSPSETTRPPITDISSKAEIEFSIPEAPPMSDQDSLLDEIKHFDTTKLRPVSQEDIASMPVSSDDNPYSMQSLLESGLEKMREKLQRQFSRMASICSNEEEDEFAIEDLLFVK